jgi:hypothetical protein
MHLGYTEQKWKLRYLIDDLVTRSISYGCRKGKGSRETKEEMIRAEKRLLEELGLYKPRKKK